MNKNKNNNKFVFVSVHKNYDYHLTKIITLATKQNSLLGFAKSKFPYLMYVV